MFSVASADAPCSQWPTFPQVYIDGEFYGGCDILIGEAGPVQVRLMSFNTVAHTHSLRAMTAESYTNGSLQEHLEAVMNS